MQNEENESTSIKVGNPLTPQQDNSAFKSIPVRPAPWSTKAEAGSAMNKERALNMFRTANQWLYDKLAAGASCSCGNCYLCAYNFFAATQPATTPGDADRFYADGYSDGFRHGKQSRQPIAPPPNITERARRAVEQLREANMLLADPTEAELAEAAEIIAAEFGEGEK
jgi:hypothetical protein